jgi:hypothetical protein
MESDLPADMVVLLHPVRTLAVAPVLRTAAEFDLGAAPGLGPSARRNEFGLNVVAPTSVLIGWARLGARRMISCRVIIGPPRA